MSPSVDLDDWLTQMGFFGNPFEALEATKDPYLHECFIEPEGFHDIVGHANNPRTTILFAPRGGGKTANRVMVDHWCQRGVGVGGRIFSIAYDREALKDLYLAHGRNVQAHHHVDAILKCASTAMFQYLTRYPEQYTHTLFRSRRYLHSLMQTYLDNRTIDLTLERRNLLSDRLNSTRIRQAINDKMLEQEIFGQMDLRGQSIVGLILSMLSAPDERVRIGPIGCRNLLVDFGDLALQVGMDAVYVLIDGVDEFAPFDKDPSAAATFLRSVFEDLALMELPRVAFKFFLPNEMQKDIIGREYVRSDRVYWREVIWTQTKLMEMLQARLGVFSHGSISTLGAITEKDFAGSIDSELIRCASWLPRNVLRLGALLFEVHVAEASSNSALLTRNDFDVAFTRFRGEDEDLWWTKMFGSAE